jgi:hypothetical protein
MREVNRSARRSPRQVIGLAILILVLGVFAIGCTSTAAAKPVVSARIDVSTINPATQTPARPIDIPAPTAMPLPTNTPLPTETATPTATSTPLPSPTATRKPVVKQATVIKIKPTATATASALPDRSLDFSFYWSSYCITTKVQHITLMITAHGGQPPYAYYNDATLIDQGQMGSVRYELDAPAGNPVPFKLIVIDRARQRYSETFFYKSQLRCGP